jgi:hypothetical protein
MHLEILAFAKVSAVSKIFTFLRTCPQLYAFWYNVSCSLLLQHYYTLMHNSRGGSFCLESIPRNCLSTVPFLAGLQLARGARHFSDSNTMLVLCVSQKWLAQSHFIAYTSPRVWWRHRDASRSMPTHTYLHWLGLDQHTLLRL